jgi:cobalamin biosynthesis protein CbiM
MHVPDGFLANRIAVSLDALSGASILYAARRVERELSGRMISIMGVLSAFIFASQMLNFPIFGGTSGHLVGGALLGILLGPMAGLLTMATVIIAQALFLQDGGLVALGANVFNMGAISVFKTGIDVLESRDFRKTPLHYVACHIMCASRASTDLCGGPPARAVPTATVAPHR